MHSPNDDEKAQLRALMDLLDVVARDYPQVHCVLLARTESFGYVLAQDSMPFSYVADIVRSAAARIPSVH